MQLSNWFSSWHLKVFHNTLFILYLFFLFSDDENESPDDELVQEIEDLLVSAYEKITMKDVSIEEKSDDFILQEYDDDCDSSLVMFPFLTEEDELNETLEEKG